MSRLRVSAKQLIRALNKVGFSVIRIRGSHHFLRHQDGRATVVPVHAGDTIGPGLLNQILKDAELTRDQMRDLL